MIKLVFLCLLIHAVCLHPFSFAAEQDDMQAVPSVAITVSALRSDGQVLRTGLGFIYDERTIVCSYSDVKGASSIQVKSAETVTQTSELLSFSEAMDLAVFTAPEEMSLVSPIVSSSTLGVGDSVSYWMDQSGNWKRMSGTVHQILDTGKGFYLILIESDTYSPRSGPLFDSQGRVVGWLQGKRAIPMETIASFAEKQTGKITMSEINSLNVDWKFVKPRITSSSGPISFSEMVSVSGPAAYPFRLNLPGVWTPNVSMHAGKFHVRYEDSGMCVEVRATPLNDDHVLAAFAREENIIFTDFLRAEMVPYSVEYLTGFRAYYEDTDALNPYALQAFFTISSDNLYVVSIAYPSNMEESVSGLVENIFASFRFSSR